MIEAVSGEIVVGSRGLSRPLAFATTVVAALGVGAEVLKERGHLTAESVVVETFSLSCEWNVPTLYTAALLWGSALLLALVAASARRAREPFVGHWRLLAAGFAYIGVDEVLGIHEHVGAWVKLEHVVYFDWIVPAAGLLVVLSLIYLPFLRALSSRDRRRFLLAGAIYVGGAVGMELPLGWWTARNGIDNLGYALIDALEETLEMVGLVIFLLSLLDYLASRRVSLRFVSPAHDPSLERDRDARLVSPGAREGES